MSRRVVITGGASGLGLAMAQAFRDAGDRVAVCDADPAAVAAVPEGLTATIADVTDAAAMGAFLGGVRRGGAARMS